jgi:hypothetical protein
MQLSKPPKPKATRKRLKKEILSDDFKKRKIFWKNIAENFHLTSLVVAQVRSRISPCGICGGESVTETGFSPSFSVSPCQYNSTMAVRAHCYLGDEQ